MKKIVNWYKDPDHGNADADLKYRETHRKSLRVQEALKFVNEFKDCHSILDVGCKSLGFVEMVGDQYTRRVQMDYNTPGYFTNNDRVQFIRGNFAAHTWYHEIDVVVCLEVLEHVPPPLRRQWAKRLIDCANHYVLISIPHMWKGTNGGSEHPHDGYNQTNIMEWFYPYYPDTMSFNNGRLTACFNTSEVIEIGTQEL